MRYAVIYCDMEKMEMEEEKERLDVLLVKGGLAKSRERAKQMIQAGMVFVNGIQEGKAGSTFDISAEIEVKGMPMKYVSRGGLKLEKALEAWKAEMGPAGLQSHGICLEGKICVDVGASTGGFTDCMLQYGAARVYAIDVGTDQLAEKLRQDRRVISLEKTNIRYVTEKEIGEQADFASIDVAFISLALVLGPVRGLLKPGAGLVALVKPQFEAGRQKVGKKGVIKEAKVHVEVLDRILQHAAGLGFELLGLDYSPVTGPEGNIEYLLYAKNEGLSADNLAIREDVIKIRGMAAGTVAAAHKALAGHKSR